MDSGRNLMQVTLDQRKIVVKVGGEGGVKK